MTNPIDKFEIEPGVTVVIYAEDDPDWSWVEDEPTKRKIRRGDIEQVCVVVKVFDPSGEVEGSDVLGGIVIGIDDHKQEIRDAIEAHEMIENAREDLKTKIQKIIQLNSPDSNPAKQTR